MGVEVEVRVGMGASGRRGKETEVGEDELHGGRAIGGSEGKHKKGRPRRAGKLHQQDDTNDDEEEEEDDEEEGSEEDDEEEDAGAIERAFLTEYRQVNPLVPIHTN